MGIADQEITQLDFAEIVGITDRQLRNLKRTIPPSSKKGTRLIYKLGPAVQAYIAHVQGTTQERYTARDLTEARIRKEIAQAKKEEAQARSAEVQAKRDEDAVVELAEVQTEVESIFVNVRARMRAVPSAVTEALVGIIGDELATRVQREMETLIDEALEELAYGKTDEGQLEESAEGE